MQTKLRLIQIIIFTLTSLTAYSQKGYEIEVRIPALKDSSIILGHYEAKLYIVNDTIRLGRKGIGVFKGKRALPEGMYFIFLPTHKYFDILVGKNQKFSITADTTNFIKTVKVKDSDENQLFYGYQNQVVEKRELVTTLLEKKKKSKSQEQKDSIDKTLDDINLEMKSFIQKQLSEHQGLFFATFLKALQEIEVPDAPRDSGGKITDSTYQYRYYRAHYFDNFNLADARLFKTPLFEEKLNNYIEKVVPQIPDTLIVEVDAIFEKVNGDSTIFRYILGSMLNYFYSSQIMGMDAVFVHIAEKYYIPHASWSNEAFIEKLKKEVAKKKPNLIGEIAPNINLIMIPPDHFMAAQTDTTLKSNPYVGTPITIESIKARFLVVVFWETDCGHCKKAIPLLYDSIYLKIRTLGAEVLAVHMISSVEGKRKWIDFVNDHGMYEWINAWSPYSYDYKDLYDAYLTPTIYILDSNKRIIAKHIGIEQIEDVLSFEPRKNSNNFNDEKIDEAGKL